MPVSAVEAGGDLLRGSGEQPGIPQRLLDILHQAGIKTWTDILPPNGDHDDTSDDQRTVIRFEPLPWGEPRFAQARVGAG